MNFVKNDYENDKQDGYIPPMSPDGPVDPPLPSDAVQSPYQHAGVFIETAEDGTTTERPMIVGTNTSPDGEPLVSEPADAELVYHSNNDGSAIIRFPTDVGSFHCRVSVTARVDKDTTTEVESIQNTYDMSGEHSSATSLGNAPPVTISKGGGFPHESP